MRNCVLLVLILKNNYTLLVVNTGPKIIVFWLDQKWLETQWDGDGLNNFKDVLRSQNLDIKPKQTNKVRSLHVKDVKK